MCQQLSLQFWLLQGLAAFCHTAEQTVLNVDSIALAVQRGWPGCWPPPLGASAGPRLKDVPPTLH